MSTGLGLLEAPYEARRAQGVDPENRLAWLRWRRRGIGASEAAALLGCSPYKTSLDVYMDKAGDAQLETVETLPMFLGKQAEPWIADAYEFQTRMGLILHQVCLEHPTRPYMLATLDSVREDQRPVEFKLVLGRSTKEIGEEGTDELPPDWPLQAQHQCIVADAGEVDFAVASPQWPGVKIRTVERDERLCRMIEDACAEMWDRILSHNPPPPSEVSDLRHIPYLMDEGESVQLDGDDQEAWESYRKAGEEIARLEKERDEVKVRLHGALGTASVGNLPFGGRIVRKTVHRKESISKACTYVQLTFKGDK